MTSPVWFQLLDAASGLPFNGTSADKVKVDASADVADFRKAVKSEFSNKLSSIDAGDLLIYKNKAAFNKRNAAVDDGKEEPLEEDSLIDGFGTSKKEALIVLMPSSISSSQSISESSLPTAVYNLKLDQLDKEIMKLENSEEYKTLAYKNRVWAIPKPSDQEMWEWQLLKEKRAVLKKKEEFYQNAILSMNAHSVKKSDKIRKGYKKDTAIKDERLLLSDVAIHMWERFRFVCGYENKPTFGDLKRASKFKDDVDVLDYFRMRETGEVEKDKIRDSFTEKEWIWLICLNQRVNPLLHDKLITNQDGSLRLVLEHDVYEDGAVIAKNVVRKLYGSEKKADIKDAASDSSASP